MTLNINSFRNKSEVKWESGIRSSVGVNMLESWNSDTKK